eukprot:1048420-Alexandrium_andersonii.AAC.1
MPLLGSDRWQAILRRLLVLRGSPTALQEGVDVPVLLPLVRLSLRRSCPWSASSLAVPAPSGAQWWGLCHGCGARNAFP